MHSASLLVSDINIEADLERVNRSVIEQMVDAFSNQDIDSIMNLFSDDAIYHDMVGSGEQGNSYLGKREIKSHFLENFKMLPQHHYEDAIVLVSGNQAHANWTLVIEGRSEASPSLRVRGCDYFELEEGKVKLKTAWIKNQRGMMLSLAIMRLRSFFDRLFSKN